MPEELEEQVVAVEPEEGDIEVEVVDDVAEADRPRTKRIDAEAALAANEDPDTEEMSARVRKRVNQLTFEKREVLRQLSAHQREQQALVNFTQNVHYSAKELAARATRAEQAWKTEAAARRDAELKLEQSKFVTAREANDPQKESEINAIMAKISAERHEVDRYQPTQFNIPDLPQFQPVQAAEPEIPEILPADAKWLQRNPWFAVADNEDMREFASAYELSLKKRGLRPGTDECYNEIDASLRKAFPDRFGDTPATAPPRRTTSPVVGANRVNGSNTGKKITLTASEAAMANKLGVSYQDYARFKGKV